MRRVSFFMIGFSFYGAQVQNYITYEETVWQKEQFTFSSYENHLLPHQNNGHPIYNQSFLGDRFFTAGSETAQQHPGYMDGAFSNANFVCESILGILDKPTSQKIHKV